MGAWGTAIFSDDVASDIRNDYYTLLTTGKTNEEITDILMRDYDAYKGTEDEPVFWFALALSQWNKGRLLDKVKDKALEWIEGGQDLARWNVPNNQTNYKKRAKELQKLKEKLLSPMPQSKPVRKPTQNRSPWKVGDLLAYRITGENVIGKPAFGKYVLLRVIKIVRNSIPYYDPNEYYNEAVLLGLYDWIGSEIPEPSIVDELHFATIKDYIDRVFGRQIETCMLLLWSKNEIKKREIVLLGNDPSYQTKTPAFFDTGFNKYAWYSFYNLDLRITITLKHIQID